MRKMAADSHGRRYLADDKVKGPYLTAIESNNTLYICGQGGFGADGTMADGIRAQTRTTLENIRQVLHECGWSLSDLVQVTCYLADIDEWAQMNAEYAAFFRDQPMVPTRTAVAVAGLPFGLRVELTCVASRS
ncbi:RidA family protein [Nocardia vulneris]|uniref:RidA family protein n=1 Tax=Nocardia vulneris TaxID=1141657 RepID=UPI0030D4A56B